MTDIEKRNAFVLSILEKYKAYIISVIYKEIRIYDGDLFNDMIQELTLEMIKHEPVLSDLSDAQTAKWISTVIRHKAQNHYSSKHISDTVYSDDFDKITTADIISTEDTAVMRSDLERILKKLNKKDPLSYELIFYHYSLGYTYAELSEIYQISQSLIAKKMEKARSFIIKEYNNEK